MKIVILFFLTSFFLCKMLHAKRNPFEFADEQLKNYSAIKIEKTETVPTGQQKKWKISETKNNNTHIIKDIEGNVRAISFDSEN